MDIKIKIYDPNTILLLPVVPWRNGSSSNYKGEKKRNMDKQE
jgi:hypothetical protein